LTFSANPAYPDQTVDISMELTAPSADGKHRGYYVLVFAKPK
jgi:hypothetical protein